MCLKRMPGLWMNARSWLIPIEWILWFKAATAATYSFYFCCFVDLWWTMTPACSGSWSKRRPRNASWQRSGPKSGRRRLRWDPPTVIRKKLGFEVRKENRDLRDSFSNITKGKDLSKKKVPLFYYPCSFSLSICLATPKSYMPMFPK